MNILITGSSGFLGGRIHEFFSNKPFFVGSFQGNVTDPNETQLAGIDTVIHLASVYDDGVSPEMSLDINTRGTLAVLNAAIEKGVKRFIYFSTVHVYGSRLTGTITEETLPRPIFPYAISHRAAEDFVLAAHAKKEIDGIVFRLSNSFGPPAHESQNAWMPIVNNMCKQAFEKKTITLVPSSVQERDFIPVTDVCRAVEHFLEVPRRRLYDGLFNIGDERTFSICNMARLVAQRCKEVLGYEPELVGMPDEFFTPCPKLCYSIDKARSASFTLCGGQDFLNEIDGIFSYLQSVKR